MPSKYSLGCWWYLLPVHKLPTGPQSFQGLISRAHSLSDSLCIFHPIFTHRKEREGPQMSPARPDQSVLYALVHSDCLHCSELLSWPGILLLLLSLSAPSTKVCTSVHIHQLPWHLPGLLCHRQCCPCHFLSPAGWGALFSLLLPLEWKTKWSLARSGWEKWVIREAQLC